jgi:hypothetical protein
VGFPVPPAAFRPKLSLAKGAAFGYFPRRMRQGLVFFLSVFLVGLLAVGCNALTTESETDAGPALPASVSMDPGSFLTSGVTCSNLAGAMQSYVATITDVTNASAPFPLPSSPPLPCTQSVYFEYIGLTRLYTGVIDGYMEPASELVPVCDLAPAVGPIAPAAGGACTTDSDCFAFGCFGVCAKIAVFDNGMVVMGKYNHECDYTPVQGDRHMLAKKNGQPVYPRWTTEASEPCGRYPYGTLTQSYENTALVGCGPLEDMAPGSSATAIKLEPTTSLSGTGLACPSGTTGADAGVADPVTSFDITPGDPTLAPYLGVACSTGASVTWSQGLVDGAPYAFSLVAYQQLEGPTATQQASCFATVQAGVTVLAQCDPLVPNPAPPPKPAPKAKPLPGAKPRPTP